jgi:hypothetical protein
MATRGLLGKYSRSEGWKFAFLRLKATWWFVCHSDDDPFALQV